MNAISIWRKLFGQETDSHSVNSTAISFEELCERGTLKDVRKAISSGANVNEQNRHGGTPIMRATKNSDIEVISLLARSGADVNARTVKGQTPLMIAAMEVSNPAVITTLIKVGADPNLQNHYGWTALKWAAQENRNPEIISALIQGGANPRVPGLLQACESRNRNKEEIAKVLKAAGAQA